MFAVACPEEHISEQKTGFTELILEWNQTAAVEVKFLHGCGLHSLGMSRARLLRSLDIKYCQY